MADIPINANDRTFMGVATADGQTVFAFDFLVFSAEQLSAVHIRNSDGLETPLTAITDFAVNGINQSNGGDITLLSTSVSVGDRVLIYGNTPIQRLSDFQQSGDFRAETVNTEEDLQIMMLQELARDLGKSLRFPISSEGLDTTFPAPIANRIIHANADGTAFITGPDYRELGGEGGGTGNWIGDPLLDYYLAATGGENETTPETDYGFLAAYQGT